MLLFAKAAAAAKSAKSLSRGLHTTTWRARRNLVGLGLAGGATVLCSALTRSTLCESERERPNGAQEKAPLTTLIRSGLVYSLISIPLLVDKSDDILSLCTAIPGLKQITESIIRITFFSQFVGGDTVEDTLPLLRRLRSENKGAVLGYSVEPREGEESVVSQVHRADGLHRPAHKRIVDTIIHSIDVAADLENGTQGRKSTNPADRKTWVAVKIRSLLPHAQPLCNFSSHLLAARPQARPSIPFPGIADTTDLSVLNDNSRLHSPLSPADIVVLKELYADLLTICTRAQQRGVKVIFDAEYSWYQPAIDAFTLALMQRFNSLESDDRDLLRPHPKTVQPLVYATYQAYLRRTPEHLARSLSHAQAHKYSLGVKLVRGAYHPHELAAHNKSGPSGHRPSISPDEQPPVWLTKEETDGCYDGCARMLIDHVQEDIGQVERSQGGRASPRIGVMFGTHNRNSCRMVLDRIVNAGLGTRVQGHEEGVIELGDGVTERVAIAHLYGMSDGLTDYLVNRTESGAPFVIKYVPYGALSEVMPYLSRRAIENKSVLGGGGAKVERRRAFEEIWRRVSGR